MHRHSHMHTWSDTHRHTHAHTCSHTCMHTHICTYTDAHACTYTHAHTQIYNLHVRTKIYFIFFHEICTHCDPKVGRGKAIYLIYVSICSVTCNAGIRHIASGILGKYCYYICKRHFKILLFVCVYVSVYEHTSCVCNAKIRTSHLLEVEFQVVVNGLTRVLRNKSSSSTKAAYTLNHWSISPALVCIIFRTYLYEHKSEKDI